MLKFVYLQILLVSQLGQLYNCQCEDVSPNGQSSCSQQKEWGKCETQWMKSGNFCAATCGRCTTPTPSVPSKPTIPTPTLSTPSKPTTDGCDKGDEIFRSSVADGDCGAVCRAIDICNAWVMCKSLSGCTLRAKPLLQGQCAFQTSSTDPTTTDIDGSGEMLFFAESQGGGATMMKKGPIAFTQVGEQKSALEYLKNNSDSSTFVDLASSKNLDSQLKSEIANPDFKALLCVPTNNAFDQFFDEMGITSDDLQSDSETLTQLMKQNIIPGQVDLPQVVGETIVAPSLLQNSTMAIQRLPDMGLQVSTEAMEIPAIKTQHADIGGVDLQTWVLDQVLVPPQFTVQVSVSYKSIPEFVQGQPGLTILSQILESPKISAFFTATRLFAPTDKVFNQYFEKHDIVLEDFVEQEVMLEQVMSSLLVDNLDLNEKQVFKSDIWNFGNPIEPQISLKAELSNQNSIWVINNLYPKQKQIQ